MGKHITMPTKQHPIRQPFSEQVAAIKARTENLIDTATWRDIERNAHDRAFVVAGATRANVLGDMARLIEKSAAEGKSIEWFRSQFDELVKQTGWEYNGSRNWRTRVIYTTNLRTSYATGRLQQLKNPKLKAVAPYWMYRHGGSLDPRPHHLAWNKHVLAADDEWWQTHYPPNGWGCSCYVTAVSRKTAERMGGKFTPPPADQKESIDEGWDYMPGGSVADELRSQVGDNVKRLPAALGARYFARSGNSDTAAHDYAAWANGAAQQRRAKSRVVGALSAELVEQLTARDLEPENAAITLSARAIDAALSSTAADRLPELFWQNLPDQLKQPQAVLLDNTQTRPALLYVYPGEQNDGAQVLSIGFAAKTRQPGARVNADNTHTIAVGRIQTAASLLNFERLVGRAIEAIIDGN